MCCVSLFYFVTLWKERKNGFFPHALIQLHTHTHTSAHSNAHTPRDKRILTFVHQMYVIVVELFDTTPFENHGCVFSLLNSIYSHPFWCIIFAVVVVVVTVFVDQRLKLYTKSFYSIIVYHFSILLYALWLWQIWIGIVLIVVIVTELFFCYALLKNGNEFTLKS